MTEDEKIRDKAAKILALLEGAKTEGEAQSAALALQRLLAKHGLSKEEIGTSAGNAAQPEVTEICNGWKSSFPYWQKMLGDVIAKNFRCQFIYRRHRCGGYSYRAVFIGYADDAKLALSCFEATIHAAQTCLRATAKRLREEFGPQALRDSSERNSYYLGFVHGLKDAFAREVESDEELALAVIMPQAVVEYVERKNCGMGRATHVRVSRDSTYREAGYSDGYGVGCGDRIRGVA